MRSLLFVPGDSETKLEKSLSAGADCLLIDLEDSVAPSAKATARQCSALFLREAGKLASRPSIFVRINPLDGGLTDRDLDAIMPCGPDGILLPKSVSGQSVQHLAAKLAVREAEFGLADGSTAVMALATETAASLFHMGTYAGASRRLKALTWGAEDLSADLGAESKYRSDGGLSSPYVLARALTLCAAAAAEVAPIDTICTDFRNHVMLREECEAARRDGFVGKLAIHPDQVPVINTCFTPSQAAIDAAKAIVDAFERQPGVGVIALGGIMYDLPHLRRARQVIARAQSLASRALNSRPLQDE
jgi:citrate lyase subunit beta/citryl-CoA lyase